MFCIPLIHTPALLFIPMVGVGMAWASLMGNPYIMLAGSIPPELTGVYMGIFNLFIVIPTIIQIFTLALYYQRWLDGNPESVIRLAGGLLDLRCTIGVAGTHQRLSGSNYVAHPIIQNFSQIKNTSFALY